MSKKENSTIHRVARLVLAVCVLVMLLAQLFTFEKFPGLLADASLWGGWAVVLVVLELLWMPYLVDMRVSAKARRLSAEVGMVVLILLGYLAVNTYGDEQSALFGATVAVPGSWAAWFLAGLWGLFFVVVWGERKR